MDISNIKVTIWDICRESGERERGVFNKHLSSYSLQGGGQRWENVEVLDGILRDCLDYEDDLDSEFISTRKQDVVFTDGDDNIVDWRELSNIDIGYCIMSLPEGDENV